MNAPNRSRIRHRGKLGHGKDSRLYTALPSALARDAEITPMAAKVALYVWSHSEGYELSAGSVAEAVGASRNSVSKALDNLEARGWLVRQSFARPGRKPFKEDWYIQLSNDPFTAEQVAQLSAVVIVEPVEPCSDSEQGSDDINDATLRNFYAGSDEPCAETEQGYVKPCAEIAHQRSASSRSEVKDRSANTERYVSNASGPATNAATDLDPVQAVCARFRQQLGEAGYTRGLEVTSKDRLAARQLLNDGYTPETIEQMTGWALRHKSYWAGVVDELAKVAGNASKIHHQWETDRQAAATTEYGMAKKDATALEWASLATNPDAILGLLATPDPTPAIEATTPRLGPVIELTPQPETLWRGAA
ncbi:helix-turn-helix domain-containing protein [Nocardia higoensis]|uniref:Helix-turn-helix domain-containing protein n=1 Tax=Nocardia higoensis TaxID=228599 RepID=A0ABS0DM23_9NOCA|nr:helix-turn-helix domain-containing protein [Nocardia higoensis]MBF6358094.1 helix-turn-helix domain-containing protein [Nocardia higoensis]